MTALAELKSVAMGSNGLTVGSGVTIAELIIALGNVRHPGFGALRLNSDTLVLVCPPTLSAHLPVAVRPHAPVVFVSIHRSPRPMT